MPADGPLELDDRIVWFKNGNIHREDGPAIEFKDGRKLWALKGQEVTEQEAAAHRLENERRQVRELSDQMWESHEAEQQRQYHTGLNDKISVDHALSLKKPAAEQA
jgi:hypothetical protein